MRAEFAERHRDRLVFVLRESSPALANALRRAMLEEVPTLAIEEVEFIKNSSALYDEIIAHRLGLLPLRGELGHLVLPERCACAGQRCPSCTIKASLKAKGPGMVYASELNFEGDVKPVHPGMPIVNLLKGQELELEASAVLGLGRTHSKWSPCHAWYRGLPQIKIVRQRDKAEEIASLCPTKVFEVKANKLIVRNPNACHLCLACVDGAEPGELEVKGSDKEFLFFVESFGQLSAIDIVKGALDAIDANLAAAAEELKGKTE